MSALSLKLSLNYVELDHNVSYNFAFKNLRGRISYSIEKTEFQKTRFYRKSSKSSFRFSCSTRYPQNKRTELVVDTGVPTKYVVGAPVNCVGVITV